MRMCAALRATNFFRGTMNVFTPDNGNMSQHTQQLFPILTSVLSCNHLLKVTGFPPDRKIAHSKHMKNVHRPGKIVYRLVKLGLGALLIGKLVKLPLKCPRRPLAEGSEMRRGLP